MNRESGADEAHVEKSRLAVPLNVSRAVLGAGIGVDGCDGVASSSRPGVPRQCHVASLLVTVSGTSPGVSERMEAKEGGVVMVFQGEVLSVAALLDAARDAPTTAPSTDVGVRHTAARNAAACRRLLRDGDTLDAAGGSASCKPWTTTPPSCDVAARALPPKCSPTNRLVRRAARSIRVRGSRRVPCRS